MSRIAVIVPVLGRPQNAAPLVESLMASTDEADLVFVCSPNDCEQKSECLSLSMLHGSIVYGVAFKPGPGDYAKKIQAGYEFSRVLGDTPAPLVLLAADDLIFRPGWLEAVERIAGEYDVGVIGTNDNANPTVKAGKHSTHPVVRRCYIDRYGGSVGEPGQIYCELYDHQFVDNELVATAMARGCYAHAHDAVVEHRHPLYNHTVKRDTTYAKGQARGREDHALFQSRRHLWEQEVRV